MYITLAFIALPERPDRIQPAVSVSARTCGESLKCTQETSFEALQHLRGHWDDAVIRLGGSIYMSYDWARTWWEFYGAGKELRIFLFTSADRVVGILPLYIDSLGWGPLRFRVARLVG